MCIEAMARHLALGLQHTRVPFSTQDPFIAPRRRIIMSVCRQMFRTRKAAFVPSEKKV